MASAGRGIVPFRKLSISDRCDGDAAGVVYGICFDDYELRRHILAPEYSHHWEGLGKRPQESRRRPGLGRYSHSRIQAAAGEVPNRTG